MKNLTFLSNQTKNETIHSGNRLETVSTMWRNLATLLLVLTLGIGNAWGAIASGTYTLVTSTSDLEAGAHYIIANGTSGTVKCISNVENTNNRKTVSTTVSSSKITVSASSTIMTFTLGGSTDAWTFYTDNYAGTAGYLASAASGNNNYCRVISTSTTCTISFSGDAAVITLNPHSTRNILRYNPSDLFACYSTGQNAIYLYKKSASSCTPPGTALSVSASPTSITTDETSTLSTSGGNGSAVTYTVTSANASNATISSTTFSATAAGTYTIQASQDDYNGTCGGTATVNITVTSSGGGSGETFELVTDEEDLSDGDEIIILEENGDYALSTTQNSNNRAATGSDFTLSGTTVTVTGNSVQVLTLGASNGNWTLYTGSGYLYASSSSANQLKTRAANSDENSEWGITISSTIASIVAQGSSSRNVMQYNYNNGSPIFACYGSASQTALKIYKKGSPCSTDLATPTGLTATPSLTSAVLSWNAVPNAGNYAVTINGNVYTTSSTSYTVTGLTSSTTYTWKVRALQNGDYCKSAEASSSVTTTAPSTIDLSKITDASQLSDGMTIAIGTAYISGRTNDQNNAALGVWSSGNNIPAVAATYDAGRDVITIPDAYVYTLKSVTGAADEYKWQLKDDNGKWLYAAGGTTNNYLKAQTTNDANGYWSITIDGSGNARMVAKMTDSGTKNTLLHNVNGSTNLYACYLNSTVGSTNYSDPVLYGNLGTRYTITVVVSGGNGTATASPGSVTSTGTATITATPNDGYEVNTITITSGTGTLSERDGNSCTISNVSTDVTVTVTFSTLPPCTESAASFASNFVRLTYPKADTYTNTFTTNNTSSKTYSSSNTLVATVNSAGAVTVVGMGTTIITVRQLRDKTNNLCAVEESYTLVVEKPDIEVVEVTADDKIIIEHDLEGVSNVVMSEATTKIAGTLATDIFISKYYEAASNLKLFGLYNGTNTYIDMSKLRVRGGHVNKTYGTATWPTAQGELCYVELADVSKLGVDYPSFMLPPFTELIFWSNNYGTEGESSWTNNEALRECVDMTIDDVSYNMDDLEAGTVPNWYCLGDPVTYKKVDADGNNQFNFNGDDPLILERWNGSAWVAIDLLGAGNTSAPVATYGANNGEVQQCTTNYTIGGVSQDLNDGYGYYYKKDGVTIPLTTNRAYLVRNKDVKSGATAVSSNGTKFNTLGTEWNCTQIGGGGSYCSSGELFSEVGQYDFANYYTDWVEVSASQIGFTDNGDGTMSVSVNNLASHSCNTLRIEVTDNNDNVLATTDYKVPIMVKSNTVETTNSIFTGFDDPAKVCSTCDVVIMDGATLKKVTGTVTAVRDIEVYAGGKLWVPSGQTFTTNQLIMRSKGDVVPYADIQGTLTRYNTTINHDKRIPGTRWYFFTLPYDCDLTDITFRDGDPAVHGTDYLIKYYDGAERASSATAVYNGSAHWKQFAGPTLLAGQGYIVAVEPKAGHTYSELCFPMKNPDLAKTTETVTVHAYGGNKTDDELRPNHKGWNLVGNPFLNTYNSGVLGEPLRSGTLELGSDGKYTINTTGAKDVRFVYVPIEGGSQNYETKLVSGQELNPFFSYFVQIGTAASKDGGDNPNTDRGVAFTSSNVQKASIVRRAAAELNDEPIMVAVDLTNDKQESDETTLLISDQFTDDFEIMDDGFKWRGDKYTNYTNPVIATRNNEGEMAFNALPDYSAAVTGVPVNFYAAYDGEYSIALNSRYGLVGVKSAQLFDATTNQYYDLMANDYVFSTVKGNNTERFRLFVEVDRNNAPTGNTELEDGQLSLTNIGGTLILSGLNEASNIYVYDMSGKLMQSAHTNGNGEIWRTNVPATGVYFVRVNNQNGQQTLRAVVK